MQSWSCPPSGQNPPAFPTSLRAEARVLTMIHKGMNDLAPGDFPDLIFLWPGVPWTHQAWVYFTAFAHSVPSAWNNLLPYTSWLPASPLSSVYSIITLSVRRPLITPFEITPKHFLPYFPLEYSPPSDVPYMSPQNMRWWEWGFCFVHSCTSNNNGHIACTLAICQNVFKGFTVSLT